MLVDRARGRDGAVTRADGGCARFRFLQGEVIRVEPRELSLFCVYAPAPAKRARNFVFFPSSWGALHLECTKLLCKKGQMVYVTDTVQGNIFLVSLGVKTARSLLCSSKTSPLHQLSSVRTRCLCTVFGWDASVEGIVFFFFFNLAMRLWLFIVNSSEKGCPLTTGRNLVVEEINCVQSLSKSPVSPLSRLRGSLLFFEICRTKN